MAVTYRNMGASPSAPTIATAARHAEALGFADVWVSDHVIHPASQSYPSPHLFDPLTVLTWAAASAPSIGLGTSVLVVPQHNPLELANSLASLDALSGGRLTLGVGVGWSEAEFDALGYSFHDRGRRTDEILRLLRACWTEDPVTFRGEFYECSDIRVLPHPVGDLPIWVGGSGPRAHHRAVTLGHGFQLIGLTPDECVEPIRRLRAERPEESFQISLRTGWDPLGMDQDRIRRERDEYEAAGVGHVVAAPWQKSSEDWLRSMELLAELVELTPA